MKTFLLAVPALLALAVPASALACDCAMSHEGHHAATGAAAGPADPSPAAGPVKGAQVVQVAVTDDGFVPAAIKVKRGQPVTLQVTRKTDQTCATEIVMKDFGVNQKLPLGKTVSVTITPKGPGAFRYACGMDMITGVLTVD